MVSDAIFWLARVQRALWRHDAGLGLVIYAVPSKTIYHAVGRLAPTRPDIKFRVRHIDQQTTRGRGAANLL
eukprot:3574098-Prymnesium_polylepis.1